MQDSLEGHADNRYDGELNEIHLLMLEMGGLALNQSQLAMRSLIDRDTDAAQEVLTRESRVDALEVKADEQILDVIGRRGPVARDLRVVMAFSKAVKDLERIGDEAARIAKVTLYFNRESGSHPSKSQVRDIYTMGELAISVLGRSLEAFDDLDAERATRLLSKSEELEVEFQSALRRLTTFVLEDARNVGHVVNITLVIKSLERIGQLAVNLAEYVVYLVSGLDVRAAAQVATAANPGQSGASS